MANARPPDETAIREQAYYLWEQDGRPAGRDMEFWSRAAVALASPEQMAALTDAPPKRAAKSPAKPVPKASDTKLKTAAGKIKSAPTKTARSEHASKPKKK